MRHARNRAQADDGVQMTCSQVGRSSLGDGAAGLERATRWLWKAVDANEADACYQMAHFILLGVVQAKAAKGGGPVSKSPP